MGGVKRMVWSSIGSPRCTGATPVVYVRHSHRRSMSLNLGVRPVGKHQVGGGSAAFGPDLMTLSEQAMHSARSPDR